MLSHFPDEIAGVAPGSRGGIVEFRAARALIIPARDQDLTVCE